MQAYLLLATKALIGQSLQLSHTNFSTNNMVIFQRQNYPEAHFPVYSERL